MAWWMSPSYTFSLHRDSNNCTPSIQGAALTSATCKLTRRPTPTTSQVGDPGKSCDWGV